MTAEETPNEKGEKLLQAVKSIETTIIRRLPGYAEGKFLVTPKKVVKISGVTHEIDLWIDIDLGRGYDSLLIFECKNWQAKVDKNEIIVFSQKINAVKATKGLFVAKSFTRDAVAQAQLDKRIELVLVDEIGGYIPLPANIHFVVQESSASTIEVVERGASSGKTALTELPMGATATLKGRRINLKDYIEEWVTESSGNCTASWRSDLEPDGVYERTHKDRRTYGPGEFIIDGVEYESIEIDCKVTFRVARPTVVSSFDIKTRGRTWALSPVDTGTGGAVHFTLVAI